MSKYRESCPFCDAPPDHVHLIRYESHGVHVLKVRFWLSCQLCDAQGPKAETEDEAVEKWNYLEAVSYLGRRRSLLLRELNGEAAWLRRNQ